MDKDYNDDLLDTSVWDQKPLDAASTPDAASPQVSSSDYLDTSVWDTPVSTPEMPEDDDLSFGDVAGDVGAKFGMGAGGLAKGAGWLLDWAGMDDSGEALKAMGQRAIEFYHKGLSDVAKAELDKEFVTVKEGGKWYNPFDWERPEDAAGLYAAFLMGVESLPATVLGMGAGGVAGKGIWALASKTKTIGALDKVAKAGRMASARGASATDLAVKAGKRAERIQKWGARASGAFGYGAGEALPAAGMAGMAVEEDILAREHDFLVENAPPMYMEFFDATANMDMEFDERVDYAKEQLADIASSEAGMEAGMWTFMLGAPMGAASAPLFNKAVPWAFKGGKVRGAITEGAGEAMQEFAQSGAEQYISNLAIQKYADENMDVARGIVNAAIGGAVSGFGMGAAFGAAGTPTAATRGKMDEQQESTQLEVDNLYKLKAFGEDAVAGLVEKHNMTPAEADELTQPVFEKYFADKNIIEATSDLKHLEQYGRYREKGVDDQSNAVAEEFGVQQEASRNGVDYYMIPRTVGADNGRIDAMRARDAQGTGIHVIEQVKEDGTFDEHKVVFGSNSEEEAVATYQRYYRGFDDENDRNVGSVTAMNEEEFKGWLKGSTAENAENLDTQEILDEQENETVSAQQFAEEQAAAEGEVEVAAAEGEIGATEEPAQVEAAPVTGEETADVPRETSSVITTDTNIKKAKETAKTEVAPTEKAEKFTGTETKVTTDTNTAKAADRAVNIRYSLSAEGIKAKGGGPLVFSKEKQRFVKNKDYVKPGTGKWADNYFKIIEEDKGAKPVLNTISSKSTQKKVRTVLSHVKEGNTEEAKKAYLEMGTTNLNTTSTDALWAIAIKVGAIKSGQYGQNLDGKGKAKPTREMLRKALKEWAGPNLQPKEQVPLFSLGESGQKKPWTTKSSGDGQLYITRHGENAGTPHRTRQSANDLAITLDEEQLLPDYAFYLLQYLQPQIAAKARGTAQQAIRKGDVDEALEDYFTSQTRYSLKELARRKGASSRMKEFNKERSEQRGHLMKTVMRKDWTELEDKVDASAAGAMTSDEIQEAVIDWLIYGTESKYFKRWFAESQTVDAIGEPIRFYHGSGDNIEAFTSGKRGFVSVSTNPEVADIYARYFSAAPGKSPVIYPLYVKAEKVFDYRNKKMRRSLLRYVKKQVADGPFETWFKPKISTGEWIGLESKEAQQFMKERGYDAFWMQEEGTMNLGVFKPENIKSAVGNTGTFIEQANTPIVYSLSNTSTDIFVSAIEKWVDERVSEQNIDIAKLQQGFNNNDSLSNKGLKKEEVEDIGLLEWLEQKSKEGRKVSKADLLDFVRMSQTQLYEIESRPQNLSVYQAEGGIGIENAERQIERIHQYVHDTLAEGLEDRAMVDTIMEDYRAIGTEALTDYASALFIGEVNAMLNQAHLDLRQAELYVKQAQEPPRDYQDELRVGRTKFHNIGLFTGNTVAGSGVTPPPTYREFLLRIPRPKKTTQDFLSQHWDDKNTIIHMRMWGQFNHDSGATTLIVEEVQSDWHQQGSRYGYGDTGAEGEVPDAPMRGSFKLAAMKRLIRYAAENGYDEVAWTSGDIQQDRYDLSKIYSKIELNDNVDGTYRLTITDTSGVAHNISQHPETGEPITRRQLGYHVGEELADKLLARMENKHAQLEGDEVRWEAKGVKDFYDHRHKYGLVKLTQKYIKRFKSKVGVKEYQVKNQITGQMESYKLWQFPITRDMRNFVLQNPQTRYSLSNNIRAEVSRRIELMQIQDYLTRYTTGKTKPRSIKRRLIHGMEAGLYSQEALRHSGLLQESVERDEALKQIAQRLRGMTIRQRTSIPPHVLRQEIRRITSGWEDDWVVREGSSYTGEKYELPTVIVHEDNSTLPDYIIGSAMQYGLEAQIEGTIDPLDRNIIHIVANKIGSIGDLHRVFIEEAVGHYGLPRLLGPKFESLMEEILPDVEGKDSWNILLSRYTHLAEMIQAGDVEIRKARKAGRKPNERVMARARMAKLVAVEELVAKQDVSMSIWEKVVSWLRDFFRSKGMHLSYTELDFRRLMEKSADAVIRGKRAANWGKMNHVPQHTDGVHTYSLMYGGVLDSALYKNVKEKFKQNDTVENILTRLRGGAAKGNWQRSTPETQNAAGKLGFKATELEMNGALLWLSNLYEENPKQKVSPEMLLEKIKHLAPTVQFVGRKGHLRFMPPPLSQAVQLRIYDEQRRFDDAAAERHYDYIIGDEVNRILDEKDHKELRDLLKGYGYNRSGVDYDKDVLSPYFFSKFEDVYMNAPAGIGSSGARLLLHEHVDKYGADPRVMRMWGIQSADAPISTVNANVAIRSWLSRTLIAKARDGGNKFTSTYVNMAISVAGITRSSANLFKFQFSTSLQGKIEQITAANDIDWVSYYGAADAEGPANLVSYLQEEAEKYNQKIDANKLVVDPQRFIRTTSERFLKQRLEKIEDKPLRDVAPESIFPESPIASRKVHDLLIGLFSQESKPVFEETPTQAALSSQTDEYSSYMLDGGKYPEVISVQIHNDPDMYSGSISGNTTVPDRGSQFHYGEGDASYGARRDVAHARCKIREVKGVHFPDWMGLEPNQKYKVLAMEEFQSDWASYIRSRAPVYDEVNEYVEDYAESLQKAYITALNEWGYKDPSMTWLETDTVPRVKEILRDTSGWGSSQQYYMMKVANSPMWSEAFMLALEKADADVAKNFAKAKAAWDGLESDVIKMPWSDNYVELMLKAVVGFARQQDEIKAVTWPDGFHVASVYGSSYIGEQATHYSVGIDDFRLVGYKYSKNEHERWEGWKPESTDVNEIAAMISTVANRQSAMHPNYNTWHTDHLDAIVKQGGTAKDAALEAYDIIKEWHQSDRLSADMERLEKRVNESPNLLYQSGKLWFYVGEEKLYNSRLHRMIYNIQAPSIGKKLVRDTKGMKKEKQSSLGKLFVEDAYNRQYRGDRPSADPSSLFSEDSEYEVDYTGTDLRRLWDSGGRSSRWVAYDVAGWGRSGHKLRSALRYTGDYVRDIPVDELRTYTNNRPVTTATTLTTDEANHDTTDLTLEEFIRTHDLDMDGISPSVGLGVFYQDGAGESTRVEFPMGFGSDMAYMGDDYAYGFDTTPGTSLMYRFGYHLMKRVWGIENPNPLKIPRLYWQNLYMEIMYKLNKERADGNWDTGDFGREVQRMSQEMDYGGDATSYLAHEIDTDFEYNESRELNNTANISARIMPKGDWLDWIRENAVVKDQFDGSYVAAILMNHEDKADYEAVKAQIPSLPAPEQDWKKRIIPSEYLGVKREGAAVSEPEYSITNPQYSEQVQNAILMTDRVKEVPLVLPFSLGGKQKDHDLVDSKIARSNTHMSIPDRIAGMLSEYNSLRESGDLLWGMKQGVLDNAASVERWEKRIMGDVQDAAVSPYKMMHMTKNLPSVMAAIAKAGIPEMREGAFQPVAGRKGFIEILRPLYEHPEGDMLRLWEGYAAARRANELIDQQNPDGTDREKLFTREEIDQLLGLEEQYPEFRSVFDEWTKFNNDLLNLAVKHGVLSSMEREAWSQNAYVPFYRAMEEVEGVGIDRGFGRTKGGVEGQYHGIRRLRGGTQKLDNVIENMWLNTASLIDKVYKNEAMTRVVDMLDGIAMKQIEMPWEAVRVSNNQIASALKKAGLLTGDAVAQVRAMSTEQKLKWNTIFRRVKPSGENVVSVMRDGKLHYYEVEDELLLRSLKGMESESLFGMMKVMGMSKSLLTRMITIDPAFMLANWMRDTLSAWVTSDANFVPVADSIKSMGDVFGEKGTFVKMMMSGAGGGGFYDLTAGNVTRALDEELHRGLGSWIGKAWKGYMKLGAASENSNRLAIANRVIAKGGTAAEAMYQAQDIMNFTMSGDYAAIRFLIRTVPFLNARMQGIYRLYRGAKSDPVGFMIKGGALMAASLALLARNWDDDDYESTEEWMKDINWNFYVDGIHYAIPKPFEVGLLFGTIPERMVRAMLKRDDLGVTKEALVRGFAETLAFNPIPQLFKPMVEQYANHNMFTGRAIESMALSRFEEKYRATPWTSPSAKLIGEAMPDWSGKAQSPVRIQHLIRAYTGTVGLYTMNSVDWVIRQANSDLPAVPTKSWYHRPVISRIVKGPTDTTRYNKYADKIYTVLDESQQAQNTFNMLAKQGRVEEARELARKRFPLINTDIIAETGQPRNPDEDTARKQLLGYKKELQELSLASREVMWNKELNGDQKRELMDNITRSRNQVLNSTGALLKQINEIRNK